MINSIDEVVIIKNLHKKYGNIQAVKDISLTVKKGEIFGLIGPDGAGKTSIFNILSGITSPDSGEVKTFESLPSNSRQKIGYLTQQFSFYNDLSINENLEFAAKVRKVPEETFKERRNKYLKLMNLEDFSDRLAGQLSGGMRQKLALCCVLIYQPLILLLDEPTTGVDPVSRRDFWDVLSSLSAEDITIIIATPYLDEAERCNRIALVYDGLFEQIGTPAKIRNGLPLESVFVDLLKKKATKTVINAFPYSKQVILNTRKTDGQNEMKMTVRDSNDNAIGAYNLCKTFDSFVAVKNVNLEVKYGEVFGLLGANGAGKTTTVKMLCGLLSATSGEIYLGGETGNLRSSGLRQRIGYMSQKFTLYNDLTILENLKFYCGVYSVPQKEQSAKIEWVLNASGLEGQENLLTGLLPGGWKQRVSFGASIMHEPEILFLDEPTSGVDPLARRMFWQTITDLAQRGTAIIVITHYLEEAENCSRMAFMDDGQIIAQGTPNEIKNLQTGSLVEIIAERPQQAYLLLKKTIEPWKTALFGSRIHVNTEKPDEEICLIKSLLESNNIKLFSTSEIPFSLEDVFISLIEKRQ